VKTRRKEQKMPNAAYGMLAMLPVAFWVGRVRDGEISTIDPDA
jgi:hypothetical protein